MVNFSNYPNFKGVLWLSFCFHVQMLTYYSSVVIQATVLREGGYEKLGFYSLIVLFVCLAIFAFLAPVIVAKITPIRIFQFSCITFAFWNTTIYLCTLDSMPHGLASILLIIGSGAEGTGSGLMWVCQGKVLAQYIRICPERAGFYSGIFWTIVLAAQLVGFVYNALLLAIASPSAIFMINAIIGIVALVLFIFLPKPILPSDYVEETSDPIKQLKGVIGVFADIKTVKIYSLFVNSAVAVGVSQIAAIPMYTLTLAGYEKDEQLRLSSLTMIISGVGSMLAGQILGTVNDRFSGSKSVAYFLIFFHLLQYGTMFIVNEIASFNILCFISAFFMGTADGAQMTQLQILISNEFTSPAPAFAALNIVKGIGIAISSSVISTLATQSDFRVFFLCVIAITVGSQIQLLLTFKFTDQQKKDKGKSVENEMGTLLNKS